MTKAKPATVRRYAVVVLKSAVSLVLVGYVVHLADLETITGRLRHVNLSWLALAALVLVLQPLIAAERWRRVLRSLGHELSYKNAVAIVWAGLFFSQTLPSTIGGDVVRIWKCRRHGIGIVPATNSVLLDRISALAATVGLVLLGAPILLSLIDDDVARMTIAVAIVAAVGGIATLPWLDRLPWYRSSAPVRYLGALARDARSLFARPGRAASLILLSAVIALLSGLAIATLAQSLGVDVAVGHCVVLMPIVLTMAMVPITIAGWGLRELSMVAAFAFAGVSSSDAALLSLIFGVAVMLVGLPGGISMWSRRAAATAADKPAEESSLAYD